MIRPASEIVAEAKKACRGVSPAEAAEMARNSGDVLILDVREPEEVAKGKLAASRNVPRGVLEMKIEKMTTDENRPILVHCAKGARAALAARALQEMGFRNVCFIDGSYEDIAEAFSRPAG